MRYVVVVSVNILADFDLRHRVLDVQVQLFFLLVSFGRILSLGLRFFFLDNSAFRNLR